MGMINPYESPGEADPPPSPPPDYAGWLFWVIMAVIIAAIVMLSLPATMHS